MPIYRSILISDLVRPTLSLHLHKKNKAKYKYKNKKARAALTFNIKNNSVTGVLGGGHHRMTPPPQPQRTPGNV